VEVSVLVTSNYFDLGLVFGFTQASYSQV
jgi:hypothetical protein